MNHLKEVREILVRISDTKGYGGLSHVVQSTSLATEGLRILDAYLAQGKIEFPNDLDAVSHYEILPGRHVVVPEGKTVISIRLKTGEILQKIAKPGEVIDLESLG